MNGTLSRPQSAAAVEPVLTATDEDYVLLANLVELGLSSIAAFAVRDAEIGLKVLVDEQVPLDARNGIIDAAFEYLIEHKAERFVLIDDHGLPVGGVA